MNIKLKTESNINKIISPEIRNPATPAMLLSITQQNIVKFFSCYCN